MLFLFPAQTLDLDLIDHCCRLNATVESMFYMFMHQLKVKTWGDHLFLSLLDHMVRIKIIIILLMSQILLTSKEHL